MSSPCFRVTLQISSMPGGQAWSTTLLKESWLSKVVQSFANHPELPANAKTVPVHAIGDGLAI
ncbi:MAG: hypothetical protein AAFR26_10870 [Cyanobacteria bacterium J06626_4]